MKPPRPVIDKLTTIRTRLAHAELRDRMASMRPATTPESAIDSWMKWIDPDLTAPFGGAASAPVVSFAERSPIGSTVSLVSYGQDGPVTLARVSADDHQGVKAMIDAAVNGVFSVPGHADGEARVVVEPCPSVDEPSRDVHEPTTLRARSVHEACTNRAVQAGSIQPDVRVDPESSAWAGLFASLEAGALGAPAPAGGQPLNQAQLCTCPACRERQVHAEARAERRQFLAAGTADDLEDQFRSVAGQAVTALAMTDQVPAGQPPKKRTILGDALRLSGLQGLLERAHSLKYRQE